MTKKLDNAVIAKLAAEGLTIHSAWSDINRVLSKTVSPDLCFDAVIRMQKAAKDAVGDVERDDPTSPPEIVIRWVVTENTPGYLPDGEPAEFELKSEAEDYALELKYELLDLGYKVVGTKRTGYHANRGGNDLGRVICINPAEPE